MALKVPGLRVRILAPVVMVALPALALLIYMNIDRRQREADAVTQNALRLARLAAANQERLLEGTRRFLVAMSQSHDVRIGTPQECHDYLKRLLEQYGKGYTNLGVTDGAGVVRCSGIAGQQMTVGDRSYFTLAIKNRSFAVGDQVIGRRTGGPALGFGYPLIDADGQARGVVYATMNLHDLNRSLTDEQWPASMTLTVTDRHGAVVARHPDAEHWLGETLPTGDPVARLIAAAPEGTTEVQEDGEARLIGFVRVTKPADTGLVVRVEASKSQALRPVNLVMYEGLSALGVAALLIMAGANAASDRLILRPIRQLVEASRRLERGDLSARVTSSTTIPELNELAKAFDHMAASLEEREAARVRSEAERKHLAQQYQQAQKMDAIGRLAGGIAHDFNNILTAIMGYTELLLRDRHLRPVMRSDIEEVHKAAESAAALTKQLLAFSRQELVEPTTLNLNRVITDMGSMLGRLIGEDVNIGYRLAADLGPVQADRGQIEQVVLNLIVNARDAMPNGGNIVIETLNLDVDEGFASRNLSVVPGPHVMLAVTDSGQGMSADVQEHLFEPFFTTKPTGKGTGLGLATVYGIVKQNGGTLSVYSEPGHGSTFKIFLPRAEHAIVATSEAHTTAASGCGQAILVLEDDTSIRELVCKVLSRYGYHVLSAHNGEEATAVCERHRGPIHLLVSDVVMPGRSGPIIARQLKAMRPEMKVLYMSGYTADAIVRDGVLMRDAPFLPKPFAPTQLAQKVYDVLTAPDSPGGLDPGQPVADTANLHS